MSFDHSTFIPFSTYGRAAAALQQDLDKHAQQQHDKEVRGTTQNTTEQSCFLLTSEKVY
jgi:hypothetical protein